VRYAGEVRYVHMVGDGEVIHDHGENVWTEYDYVSDPSAKFVPPLDKPSACASRYKPIPGAIAQIRPVSEGMT
jgi:hypothetical protein